jgi:hypothetical protein
MPNVQGSVVKEEKNKKPQSIHFDFFLPFLDYFSKIIYRNDRTNR